MNYFWLIVLVSVYFFSGRDDTPPELLGGKNPVRTIAVTLTEEIVPKLERSKVGRNVHSGTLLLRKFGAETKIFQTS